MQQREPNKLCLKLRRRLTSCACGDRKVAVSALFVKNRLMTSCNSQSFVKVPVTRGYTAAVLAFPGQRFLNWRVLQRSLAVSVSLVLGLKSTSDSKQ